MRIAFIGFRHAHILGLYRLAAADPRFQVVGACENDAAAANEIRRAGEVKLTHAQHRRMLDEARPEAVAIGDCYAFRGRLIVEAMQRGCHVISDKPVCTSEEELDAIAALAGARRLCLGCLLDLRSMASFRTARRLIRDGAIGEVRTVAFSAQHPLLLGKRPAWYFEPGLHGGTINDIAIHAFDAIPWMTGRAIASVDAARAWNARVPAHPHFQDAAQLMVRLGNGGGVLGDVSYLAPDGCGYAVPQYWRMTFHGDGGMIECNTAAAWIARSADAALQPLDLDPPLPNAAVEAFLAEVAGQRDASPSTAEIITASRVALTVQQAAGRNSYGASQPILPRSG